MQQLKTIKFTKCHSTKKSIYWFKQMIKFMQASNKRSLGYKLISTLQVSSVDENNKKLLYEFNTDRKQLSIIKKIHEDAKALKFSGPLAFTLSVRKIGNSKRSVKASKNAVETFQEIFTSYIKALQKCWNTEFIFHFEEGPSIVYENSPEMNLKLAGPLLNYFKERKAAKFNSEDEKTEKASKEI